MSRVILGVVIALVLLVVAGFVFYGLYLGHVQTNGGCTYVNGQPVCSTPPPFP
jgi:hypothetical protein